MFDDEDQKTLFTVAFLAKAAVNRKTFNNYKNLFEKLKVFFFFGKRTGCKVHQRYLFI